MNDPTPAAVNPEEPTEPTPDPVDDGPVLTVPEFEFPPPPPDPEIPTPTDPGEPG